MTGTEKLWYWRRNLALWLDFLPFALLFTLLFTVLSGAASDSFRLSGFGITMSRCGPGTLNASVVEAGTAMMPGVAWNQAAFCEISSFGLAANRIVHLIRAEKGADSVTRTVSVTIPIDAAGQRVNPYYLDWVGYLAFVAVVLAFQTSPWRATPAMRLFRIQLTTDNGDPVGFKRAVLRLIYATLLLVAVIIVAFAPIWLVAVDGWSAWLAAPGLAAALAGYLAWWRPFELKRSLPRAPLHDLWAGTRIVRISAKAT